MVLVIACATGARLHAQTAAATPKSVTAAPKAIAAAPAKKPKKQPAQKENKSPANSLFGQSAMGLNTNEPTTTEIYADEATARTLRDDAGIGVTPAIAGDTYDVGVDVEAVGDLHAEIHPDLPRIPNVGYLISGRLLHPGDSPGTSVDACADSSRC